MNEPTDIKLSIIVPAFVRTKDAKQQLFATLSSIAHQADRCELIVVDDSSPVQIELPVPLKDKANIRLIRHSQNKGAGAARNTGMKAAKANLVTFVDYDDELLPNTLRMRLEYALGQWDFPSIHSDQRLIQGCGWQEINQDGSFRKTRYAAASRDACDFFRGCWFCPGSTVIVNRDFILHEVGGFDENFRRLEDVDLFIRAALKGARYLGVPVLGAQILHHNTKSIAEILTACDRLKDKFVSQKHHFKSLVSTRSKQLLKAYLASEKAKAARLAGNPASLIWYAMIYFLNFPDLQPRWSNQFHSS